MRYAFLEASFIGDEKMLEEILERLPKIGIEVGSLKGLKRSVQLGKGTQKKTYDTSMWNPILLAIASRKVGAVDLLFDHEVTADNFHQLICLSKPYSNAI